MLNLVRDVYKKIFDIQGSSLLKADDDLIITTTDMINGAYTIAAQPKLPSRLGFAQTAVGNEDTNGTIVIVGTAANGDALTETVIPVAGSTIWSVGYFKTITSITGVGWAVSVDTSNDTIIVGVSAQAKIYVGGKDILLHNISGNLYFNVNAVAAADNTSFLMIATEKERLCVKDYLYLCTDGTGATIQYILFEN
jgi:hypothetical protein